MGVQKPKSIEANIGLNTNARLVSVVIPTCNRALLLDRAINSVLAQTYSNLEIIIVDDASTDGTSDLVHGIKDSRIRYVRHDTNKGGGASRNSGIRSARGELIAFLDDDDYWRPEKIERQLQHMANYGVSICGFGLNDGRNEIPGSRSRHTAVDVTPRMLRKTVVGWGTSTIMMRAHIAREIMFDPTLVSGQDWDFLIRTLQYHRIVYFDEPLVVFDVGGHRRITNGTHDQSVSQKQRRLRVLHKHRDFFGPFWLNYHEAGLLLYRIRDRKDALYRVLYAIRRCGIVPVLYGFYARFYQKTFGY